MDSAPQIPSLLGQVSLLKHELASSSCPDLQAEVMEISSTGLSADAKVHPSALPEHSSPLH